VVVDVKHPQSTAKDSGSPVQTKLLVFFGLNEYRRPNPSK